MLCFSFFCTVLSAGIQTSENSDSGVSVGFICCGTLRLLGLCDINKHNFVT